MDFYLVDVFAEQKYAGNQLVVFIGSPPTDTMQALALEMNYSETTFITSTTLHDGGYDVRIFMPNVEIPFAGHPTLGTAFVLREKIIEEPVTDVILNMKAGQIPVHFADDGVIWMRQNPARFMETYTPSQWADILHLNIEDFDDRFPIQSVTTGLPFTLIPLRTLDAVRRAKVDVAAMRELLRDSQSIAPLVFCPQTYDTSNHLNARMLTDIHGIAEDPATGSANGCLSAYLVKYRYFDTDHVQIRVEQGYEINRPSLLYHNSWADGDQIVINIGGKVFLVAQGSIVG